MWLEGKHLLSHEVPEDAPITAHDHEQVADVELIQRVVDDAIETNGGSSMLELSRREENRARDALEPLPSYSGRGPLGTYLSKGDDVVAVRFVRQQ